MARLWAAITYTAGCFMSCTAAALINPLLLTDFGELFLRERGKVTRELERAVFCLAWLIAKLNSCDES
jgi:hypothetical protein